MPVCWDVDRAAQLYRAGWTLRQLAAEIGIIDDQSASSWIKAGVVMRPARLPLGRPDVATDEILRLRDEEHLTWAAIAERVGVSEPGVGSRYRRAGGSGSCQAHVP